MPLCKQGFQSASMVFHFELHTCGAASVRKAWCRTIKLWTFFRHAVAQKKIPHDIGGLLRELHVCASLQLYSLLQRLRYSAVPLCAVVPCMAERQLGRSELPRAPSYGISCTGTSRGVPFAISTALRWGAAPETFGIGISKGTLL